MDITVRHVQCERCGAGFNIPDIGPEIRSQIIALIRTKRSLEAIRFVHNAGVVDLSHAKGIALHIPAVKGICHNCIKPFSGDGEAVCANCHALNMNW